MFQNLEKNREQEDIIEESNYNENSYKNSKIKQILRTTFTVQNILVYTISFLISLVSFGINKDLAPFGIAMLAAILSNSIPVAIPLVLIGIGNAVAFGGESLISYILISLILLFSILIKTPRYNKDNSEKRKLGIRLFFICLFVKLASLLFHEFMVYDLLVSLMYSICVFIFYKIFANSISVIGKFGKGNVFSIEEVMGAGLILALSVSSIGDLAIFGYSIKNILCILIVLVLGWKNGILVGGTAGITVGAVLGLIGASDVINVATYALSGMVAGIFSRFGKIGVIVGFALGNVAVSYFANGNVEAIIKTQEILIAALGLLVIPNKVKINIEDIYNVKLLPETTGRTLEENKETVYKLTTMSETLSEIAKNYKEAAATIVDEEELKEQERENLKIFEKELENNIEGIDDNILFDDIYSPEEGLIESIFNKLLENEVIVEKDLIDIFAEFNNYIIMNDEIKDDISQLVKIINYSYRVSKLNFIWKKKLDENKKAVSSQLQEVSNAIEHLASDIEIKEEDEFINIKNEIINELKDIQMNINSISINKDENGKITLGLFTNTCEDVEKPACNIKKITRIISKHLGQNMELQEQKCGLRLNNNGCVFTFISSNIQSIQVGIATQTKENSDISGDSDIQTKLKDGKYLIAISDGMGSGKEARKSSKMAIAMLNKLLSSGFDKDTSLRLINSTLASINEDDMYATLDISIFDLYSKKLEFIKNGACPTFVKNKRNVEVLKSVSLPTGIIDDIDLVVYDRELANDDIIVMCSDGILESSEEYTNKELWIKFLLEELETDDPQKIADIILQEAIDNNYGKAKDDMTVIVAKVNDM